MALTINELIESLEPRWRGLKAEFKAVCLEQIAAKAAPSFPKVAAMKPRLPGMQNLAQMAGAAVALVTDALWSGTGHAEAWRAANAATTNGFPIVFELERELKKGDNAATREMLRHASAAWDVAVYARIAAGEEGRIAALEEARAARKAASSFSEKLAAAFAAREAAEAASTAGDKDVFLLAWAVAADAAPADRRACLCRLIETAISRKGQQA